MGCDSSLGDFVILLCSVRVHVSSFGLLLLRLCSIGVLREALVMYRSSLLKLLSIVHGGKILTIIIIV